MLLQKAVALPPALSLAGILVVVKMLYVEPVIVDHVVDTD
jgi:hypothetical protein